MGNNAQELADSNFLIIWPKASASFGVTLASFLKQHRRTRTASLTIIYHPTHRDTGTLPRETEFAFYSGNNAPTGKVLRRESYTPILTPIIDGILTLLFLAKTGRRHHMCITAGLNLGLLVVLLRGLGVVKKTTFVVMDYWPKRYPSGILSWLYRHVYSLCSTNVDFVLDVSPTINDARIQDGIFVNSEKLLYAPHPIDPITIGHLPQQELEPDSLIWTGAFTPECGFELVIDAVELVAKERPAVIVNITSYEPFPKDLWETIQKRGLASHFRMLGYIKDEAEFQKAVRKRRAGLAPYVYTEGETTVKSFAGVGRPWTYMANGVPPIITRAPHDSLEIEQAKAGIIIKYTKDDLTRAILTLLSDDKAHQVYRQRGLELVKSRGFGPVFMKLLGDLGLSPDTPEEIGTTGLKDK
jgi:glycosyltransferase involved in cell wall biosynthesis